MATLKSSAKAKSQAKQSTPPPSAESLQAKAEHLSRSIMDSAQQIWLAGMGAFGRAQDEGTKMFEALVNEGLNLEKRTRKAATGRVDAVRDAVESRVGQVKERASDTWDRLEKVFEERVQRALIRLGVPGRDELQALIERVDRLNAELRKLTAKPAPAAKPAAARAPAKKRAAPNATAKRAPARKAAGKRSVVVQAPLSDATD